jgi:(p)ppGpp synthase/HD superfamily hydrolase
MENQLLHTASTICYIAFASTGITTPTDEQGFFHLSDAIHNRLRTISPDLNVRCAAYLFLPVIHTELKMDDLKNHFPDGILQLVQELTPLKRATCPSGKIRFEKELDAMFSASSEAVSIRLAEYLSGPSRFLRMIKNPDRKARIEKILASRHCHLSHQLMLLMQAEETVSRFKSSGKA